MNLPPARLLARKICEQLAPFCARIEIAGSIRRARPCVNDIDLVILPRPGELENIKARCAQNAAVVTDGPQNAIFRLRDGVQLDLFFARAATRDLGVQLDLFFARAATRDLLESRPGNFGSLLLCRTGSKEHNIFLAEHAKRLGRVWKPYEGVFAGDDCLAAEDEAEILTALDLEWIKPEDRER